MALHAPGSARGTPPSVHTHPPTSRHCLRSPSSPDLVVDRTQTELKRATRSVTRVSWPVRREISHPLTARERRPEAPRSMEELSIRYMELFRTSLDLIHTYGTHVNMSFFFSRTYAVRRKAPSPRPRRSSARPRHQDCGIAPGLSCYIRNSQALNHADPLR